MNEMNWKRNNLKKIPSMNYNFQFAGCVKCFLINFHSSYDIKEKYNDIVCKTIQSWKSRNVLCRNEIRCNTHCSKRSIWLFYAAMERENKYLFFLPNARSWAKLNVSSLQYNIVSVEIKYGGVIWERWCWREWKRQFGWRSQKRSIL